MSSGRDADSEREQRERRSLGLVLIGTVAQVVAVVLGLIAVRETMNWNILLAVLVMIGALALLLLSFRLARKADAPKLVYASGFLAAVAALGLIFSVWYGIGQWTGDDGNGGTPSPEAYSTTPSSEAGISTTPSPRSSTGPLTVAFSKPAPMTDVPLSGTTVTGTTGGEVPDGFALWLMILSPDDGGVHYLTDEITLANGGDWSIPTGQVGSDDQAEVGKIFTVEVVLADPAASAEFERAITEDNWDGWPNLPEGAVVKAMLNLVRI